MATEPEGGGIPFVSVVIPVYNEERHVGACLDSVLAQDYPRERVEVIVADGGSTDATRDIVATISRRDGRVRLIDNPGRTQAAGLNRAIAASRGDVIARQDGHAEWTRHHLRRSVELLASTGADNVGGGALGVGDSLMGRAIAAAMQSPFGVGGARFRYSTRTEDAATVFPGTFRRSALERVGLYDEAYPPHEDYELNHRIRATGGRVVFSPEIPTRYHVRGTLAALGRQYFSYGRSKVRVARASPGVIRLHHLAPPALVAAAPAAAVLLARPAGRRLVAAGAVLYTSACAAAGLVVAHDAPWRVRLRVPAVFPVLHVAWGLGFWAGVAEAARGRPTGGGHPPPLAPR